MLAQIRAAVLSLLLLTLLGGVAYPLVVWGIGQVAFPRQAAGSLIERDGHVVGSRLIGQNFDDPKYFWGRISATSNTDSPAVAVPYFYLNSGGSNLAPSNPALADQVKARADALRAADPANTAPIPVDLVTSSGSGLDPDISPAAAEYQVARVARVRGLNVTRVKQLVAEHTRGRQLGVLGEPRVHVLELNLALDTAGPKKLSQNQETTDEQR
jgi:K+-transporting ATPase ATPase C chain